MTDKNSLEVLPLRNWFPQEFEFGELSPEEIFIAKGGTEDTTLEPYLSDGTVKVLETSDIDHLILEKRVNQTLEEPLREVSFALLADEIGSTAKQVAPKIEYVREEDGRIYYGQEFMEDYSPFTDLKINNIDEAKDYLEAAGEVTGTLRWLNLAHGDITQMYTTGPLKGLPKDKNLMFDGSQASSIAIDFEDAHFDSEDFHKEDHRSGLEQINAKTSDEEYEAVRDHLFVNIIYRHLPDYFERITRHNLETDNGMNTDLVVRYGSQDTGVKDDEVRSSEDDLSYSVEITKLLEAEENLLGEPNQNLVETIHDMDEAYERGFTETLKPAYNQELDETLYHTRGLLEEINRYSTIDTELDEEEIGTLNTAARSRQKEIKRYLEQEL